MIGVDTNVLVRYIVQDDIEQSKDATRFIEKRISSSNPGFINQIGCENKIRHHSGLSVTINVFLHDKVLWDVGHIGLPIRYMANNISVYE